MLVCSRITLYDEYCFEYLKMTSYVFFYIKQMDNERGGKVVDKIVVKGGQTLNGKVRVEGAKNAVLPVLAAALLATKGKNVIKDVPTLADVLTINEVLKSLNTEVNYNPEKNEVIIDSQKTIK